MYVNGGDLEDVLPLASNISKLKNYLSGMSIKEILDSMRKMTDAKLRKFLNMENWNRVSKYLNADGELATRVLNLAKPEQIAVALKEQGPVQALIVAAIEQGQEGLIHNCLEYINAAFIVADKTQLKRKSISKTYSQITKRDNDIALKLTRCDPEHVLSWILGEPVTKDQVVGKVLTTTNAKNGAQVYTVKRTNLNERNRKDSLKTCQEVFLPGNQGKVAHVAEYQCLLYAILGGQLDNATANIIYSMVALNGDVLLQNAISGVPTTANPRIIRGIGHIILLSMLKHKWLKKTSGRGKK
jgi:DNA-binding phage protein